MPNNVAIGVGTMEFPFSGAAAYWRWVDLCEAGGVDSIWQTDRLVSPQPFLECMFQALGHTLPPLYCTATRVTVFASVAYWLSTRPGFELHEVWYVSVATVTLQAILIITLLLRDIGRRTREAVPTPA